MDISKLKAQKLDHAKNASSERDRMNFLELMKNLTGLYETAKPDEKRYLVENCFSNRTWNGKNVCFETSNMVMEAKNTPNVYDGGATRDTYRTFVKIFENHIGSNRPV